jgi:hypothetical protein
MMSALEVMWRLSSRGYVLAHLLCFAFLFLELFFILNNYFIPCPGNQEIFTG